MPKKIQEVTTSQKLIAKFALVGAFTPQLDETIVPVVITDDLSAGETDSAAAGFGDTRTAGGAGNLHTWQLQNAAGSGLVLEVYRSIFNSNASGGIRIGFQSPTGAALTTALGGTWHDRRKAGTPGGNFRHQAQAVVMPVPFEMIIADVLQQRVYTFAHAVILPPGQSMFWQFVSANQQADCSVFWLERGLRPDGT